MRVQRAPKSRNGCARCKKHRLKCDEGRPSCGRCSRLNVSCPGYIKQPLKWSTKYEIHCINGADCEEADEENHSSNATTNLPTLESLADSQIKHEMIEPSTLGAHDTIISRPRATSPAWATLIRPSQPIQDLCNSRISPITLYPAPTMNDMSSTLIEYYFKEVAGLFSSYDGPLNPFRTTVARLWQSSPAICYTLQSMAAACLSSTFPYLGREGLRLRREVVTLLESSVEMNDKSLLALIMIGQSTSWHNPHDLGVTFFNSARRYLDCVIADTNKAASRAWNNIQFFQEALIYWGMLLGYVTEDTELATSRIRENSVATALPRALPHPWTGFARDVQQIVRYIGNLVRKERTRRLRKSDYQANTTIVEAQKLEEQLVNFELLGQHGVISPEDKETPVWHLLAIAEVYRQAGLVQIYNTFPSLLYHRVEMAGGQANPSSQQSELDLHLKTSGLECCLESLLYLESPTHTHCQRCSPPISIYTGNGEKYLADLALSTLHLLQSIPLESRTRCLQPFLLVACCSQLHMPSPLSAYSSNAFASSAIESQLSLQAVEISRMRDFLIGRLTAFLYVLPPKPIQVCIDIVKETWRRMDRGEKEVFWVDVMIENGWETTMG